MTFKPMSLFVHADERVAFREMPAGWRRTGPSFEYVDTEGVRRHFRVVPCRNAVDAPESVVFVECAEGDC